MVKIYTIFQTRTKNHIFGTAHANIQVAHKGIPPPPQVWYIDPDGEMAKWLDCITFISVLYNNTQMKRQITESLKQRVTSLSMQQTRRPQENVEAGREEESPFSSLSPNHPCFKYLLICIISTFPNQDMNGKG